MGRIDEVYHAVLDLEELHNKGVSTVDLSSYLKFDRANISRYLNQLFQEGRVEKLDGRPVLYRSVKRERDKPRSLPKVSLDLLVGNDLSLQVPIQQAKAAILYPPRGLHTLILGETGVGKTMFAELMFYFAKESGAILANAPFVRFNCADYADNPQLVLAQIFGVKKGAFTGADCDRDGLLKKADKGIIFLDEVHRLSPQGQEMLFTYIDKGYFRPLGETEITVQVEVRIIAATTEDPQSYLLKTFMRRIPMTITLPSLKERSLQERYYLLKEFIRTEAKRLGRNIYIEKNVLIAFLLYECPNNIGQIKSDLQLSCAKAFLKYKAQNRDYILIEHPDLHQRVKGGLLKFQDYRDKISQLLQNKGDILVFGYDEDAGTYHILNETEAGKPGEHLYEMIECKLDKFRKQGLNEKEINDRLNVEIENYFKKYFGNLPDQYCKEEIIKVVNREIVELVEEILCFCQDKLGREFDKRVYYGLALHLNKSIERISNGNKIYHPKLNVIRSQYADEFMAAIEIAKLIDKRFGLETPLDEIGYLAMILASSIYTDEAKAEGKVGILAIMHGQATASSMCQVANGLVGYECAEALDMPLNMKAESMYESAKNRVVEMNKGKGILLLVDMGSLNNFGHMISEATGIKIKTISMVSTPVLLEACRNAAAGRDLDFIYRTCQELTRYRIEQVVPGTRKLKKPLLITACFTGEGAGEYLKEIVKDHLRKRPVEVISLNILDHNDFLDNIQKLTKDYQILAIVSTVNIFIEDVPFIPAPDVLEGTGLDRVEKLVEQEYQYRRIKETINTHILSCNAERLIDDLRRSIYCIEAALNISISCDVEVGIVIHLVFMVEKLTTGGKEPSFENVDTYRDAYEWEFNVIKNALRGIEEKFNIKIGDNELAYIVRMIVENSKSV